MLLIVKYLANLFGLCCWRLDTGRNVYVSKQLESAYHY